jgi:hypothetical protein
MIALERLKTLLHYDETTGGFVWLVSPANNVPAGSVAGSIHRIQGYRVIRVDGKAERAHRLAWLYVTGENPPEQIDHINGVRSDNRFCNLRPATNGQNQQNSKTQSNNRLRIKGVCRCKKTGRYKAQIGHNGENIFLGRFDTPELAHAAYVAAATKLFGKFARAA